VGVVGGEFPAPIPVRFVSRLVAASGSLGLFEACMIVKTIELGLWREGLRLRGKDRCSQFFAGSLGGSLKPWN
jgi:hypothetical protein